MKRVKKKFKKLHIRDFKGIKEKIEYWRGKLHQVQIDIQKDMEKDRLFIEEKKALNNIKKWTSIDNQAIA